MPDNNAVATRQTTGVDSIASYVRSIIPELQRALPAHLSADRVARLAVTVLRRTPDLAGCAKESFAGALMEAAALGLEVGVNGEAYLVPYSRECTLIVGYQGLVKLFWQHPLAQHIDAQPVYANDETFDYAYGTDPFLKHKPARSDRGDLVCYYAVARLSNGATPFVVATPEEVKALRAGKVGPSGKIQDPMRWMERKTVLRQLFKMVPKSVTLMRALDSDERTGRDLWRERVSDGSPVLPVPAEPPEVTVEEIIGNGRQAIAAGDPPITEVQRKRMHAFFNRLALTDRDKRLKVTSAIIGRPVKSSNELTMAEASTLIERLDQLIEDEDGALLVADMLTDVPGEGGAR